MNRDSTKLPGSIPCIYLLLTSDGESRDLALLGELLAALADAKEELYLFAKSLITDYSPS